MLSCKMFNTLSIVALVTTVNIAPAMSAHVVPSSAFELRCTQGGGQVHVEFGEDGVYGLKYSTQGGKISNLQITGGNSFPQKVVIYDMVKGGKVIYTGRIGVRTLETKQTFSCGQFYRLDLENLYAS